MSDSILRPNRPNDEYRSKDFRKRRRKGKRKLKNQQEIVRTEKKRSPKKPSERQLWLKRRSKLDNRISFLQHKLRKLKNSDSFLQRFTAKNSED